MGFYILHTVMRMYLDNLYVRNLYNSIIITDDYWFFINNNVNYYKLL